MSRRVGIDLGGFWVLVVKEGIAEKIWNFLSGFGLYSRCFVSLCKSGLRLLALWI
jgi:hypothetical protein